MADMFEKIVVGVNKAETAREAADYAVALANRFGATLHLVGAFDAADDRKHTEAFLEAIAGHVTSSAQVHAIPGDPSDAILMVAQETGADLIVVGNKGMHGARRMLGSVPNDISHRAQCSVLIVATT
jgi:nucleotide-binding universal stress UspA family protein